MSLRNRSRTLSLILCLLPGWGHVYWGRERLGLALFTVFAGAGFVALNGAVASFGGWERGLFWGGASVALAVFLVSFIDLWIRTSAKRVRAQAGVRDELFQSGTVAYLVDDLPRAAVAFRRTLAIDPTDAEAFFRLAVVHGRLGDVRQARRWLRRARRFDVDDKWGWEIRREEKRLVATRESSRAGSGGGPVNARSRELEAEETSV